MALDAVHSMAVVLLLMIYFLLLLSLFVGLQVGFVLGPCFVSCLFCNILAEEEKLVALPVLSS